jgi:glycosyltransferase involved in cell wall biosynthesis
MKVLVFAHVPPPHHGQSYMVQLMLNGFGGDQRNARRGHQPVNPFNIACYHVNARVSKTLEDIGDFRLGKFILLLGFCLQAIWCRFRYGVDSFYYVPAPGKRSALYRDWLVMFICRPFFKHVILHWHAAGLGKWLETVVRIRTRATTYNLMKKVDLSIVLSKYNQADAEKLFPQKARIVSNGITDPFPQFERDVLPRRQARCAARVRLLAGQSLSAADLARIGDTPQVFRILYLAHCMREKGLFDAIAGVRLAGQKLAATNSPITLHFTIAGNFITAEEHAEFEAIMKEPGTADLIDYVGFVSGDQKKQLLRESDLLCFPTFYQNENQPVNLIEAMAYGLPIITTRWRSLPEIFPADYPGLVAIRSPEQIAEAVLHLLTSETGERLRQIFVQNFTLESYLSDMAAAFQSIKHHNCHTNHKPRNKVAVADGQR